LRCLRASEDELLALSYGSSLQTVTVAKDVAKEAKVSTTAYGVMFCGSFMCKRKG
jgi:hypothetical protein